VPVPRAFLVNPTAGAADLVWDEPRDAAVDGYEVAWRRAGPGEEWRSSAIAPARRHRVGDLADGARYEFRLRTLSGGRSGPWTASQAGEIGPVAPVELGDAAGELSLGLQLRLFRAGLVHWYARARSAPAGR
jgi:hypothetical protein